MEIRKVGFEERFREVYQEWLLEEYADEIHTSDDLIVAEVDEEKIKNYMKFMMDFIKEEYGHYGDY
jgi:hypothetical protein